MHVITATLNQRFSFADHLFRLSFQTWKKMENSRKIWCSYQVSAVLFLVHQNLCSGNCLEWWWATTIHIELSLFTFVPIKSVLFSDYPQLTADGIWWEGLLQPIYHHWHHLYSSSLPPDSPSLHHLLTKDHLINLFLCITWIKILVFFSDISSSAAAIAAKSLRGKGHTYGEFKMYSAVFVAVCYYYFTI